MFTFETINLQLIVIKVFFQLKQLLLFETSLLGGLKNWGGSDYFSENRLSSLSRRHKVVREIPSRRAVSV